MSRSRAKVLLWYSKKIGVTNQLIFVLVVYAVGNK